MSRPPDHKFSKVAFGEALRINIPSGFSTGDEATLQALDAFAQLLLQPDENFVQLQISGRLIAPSAFSTAQ